ncbi:MAG: cation:proton antiporter, partial [Pelagibacteraceae bacterium]|nr:cation:proton antiporter [Pelagibacteraceae bacterium]
MSQIPVLILILPLLFVPIIILMRMFKVSYLIVVVSSLLNFLLITILTLNVFTNGAVFYELGGWPPPIGIRLNADMLSCLFLMLIGFMNLMCIISCKEIVEKTVSSSKVYLFYTAWLLCNTGFTGIILTDDIFNMFVFLEISSLSSYYLISQGNQKKSTFAALQYLFIGSIGAIFVLFAIGLLYMITGTLNMQDLTKQLAVVEEKQIILFAIVFLLAGVGVKSALFPLHGWLIKTYAY